MLVADSLTLKRFRKPRFKGLGFCLLYGSLTVLLGKNEVAKEGLLDILAGIVRPESGQVRFEGQPVFRNENYDELVTRIHGKNDLKSRLTVLDTIRRFMPSSGTESLADAAIRFFRLTRESGTPCGMLPLHMQRRVIYARLLAIPSPIWLINHKQDSLDAEGNELLYTLISNRCNQDGIVVMTGDRSDFISPCLPLNLDDFT